jgi:hypothetical protein
MNKTLLLASASAFAFTMAASAPAYADPGARATSESTVEGNNAIEHGSLRTNLIENSWNDGATGIAHDQQNNGANNGMGAATAVHADVTGGENIENEVSALSTADDNDSDYDGKHDPDRKNEILDTMNGFMGSATLQQNNGDNNAINAATGLDGVDGDLDNTWQKVEATADTEGNDAIDTSSVRDNVIESSLNGAKGVFTAQQNNGNVNAISAATAAAGITGNAGELTQSATADAQVVDNTTNSTGGSRYNYVTGSFNEGFAGVATVQQNNGDANGMAAATAVTGVGGDAGEIEQHAIANPIGDGGFGNGAIVGNVEWENQIGGDLTAFNGATGVITVQQNNGDANGIAAATAVAGVMGSADDIHQGAGASLLFSGAAGNNVYVDIGRRKNWINAQSFSNAEGVITVQQNNGDANSMAAATAVTGVTEDAGNIDQHAVNGLLLTGSGWNGLEGGPYDFEGDRTNLINDSMDDITGVTTVQQNNGSANHMGAATGVIGLGGSAGDIDQKVIAGTGYSGSAFNDGGPEDSDYGNLVDNALTSYQGVLTVQQNNGDANNIVALNAVTATSGAGKVDQRLLAKNVSLSNDINSQFGDRANEILNSFNDFQGVATVQQNNGAANSIVAGTGLVMVNGDSGKTNQTLDAWGASLDNELREGHSDLDNLIDPSFTNAQGILTVQQNNGSGNAMTALTGVVANTGGNKDTRQNVDAGGKVNNDLDEEGLGVDDWFSNRDNKITDQSFSDLTGVATVQQNNGSGNVMSTATAVALNTGDGKLDDTNQKVRTIGSVRHTGTVDADYTDYSNTRRVNVIDNGAFDRAAGVVTVQQNNGDNNVMAVATGVRAELNSTASSSNGEKVKRQVVSTQGTVARNEAYTYDQENSTTNRVNTLTDAFTGGVDGVFAVQQNNGNNNVIGASVAVAANINSADDIDGATKNRASTMGTVRGNSAEDKNTSRKNDLIGGAFNDGAGIITVQQNNGANNVMGSATGVVANVNTTASVGNDVTADASGEALVKNNNVSIIFGRSRGNNAQDVMNGTQGIMTVQQNNGDNNVMGSAVDVVVSTETSGFGPAASTASLSATVSGNNTTMGEAGWGRRRNTVQDSFNGASGIMTVQQNNGGNNAMGSAITTVANGITFGFNGGN